MSEVFLKNFRPVSSQGQQSGAGRMPYTTVSVTTGAGSSSAAVPLQPSSEVTGRTRGRSVMVINPTSSIVFVEFGDSGVVAVTPTGSGVNAGSTPVLPNSGKVFDGIDAAYIAAIAAAAVTIYATAGEGT